MKHILGMAKSSLDLRGAKAQKLELDVLRLVYAIQHLRAGGDEAQGYMLVLNSAVRGRVETWLSKYEAHHLVKCFSPKISEADLIRLRAEKVLNSEGMVAGTLGMPVVGRSTAALGKEVAELALNDFIRSEEGGTWTQDRPHPMGILWDFYAAD